MLGVTMQKAMSLCFTLQTRPRTATLIRRKISTGTTYLRPSPVLVKTTTENQHASIIASRKSPLFQSRLISSSSGASISILARQQQRLQQERYLSRSSQIDPNSPESKAKTFLMDKVGHEADIAEGVIDALKASGMSGTLLLESVRTMAGRYEVGEDAGLEALVEAVRLDLARKQGKRPITLYCVPPHAWKSSEEDAPDFSSLDEETPEEKQTMRSRAFSIQAMTGLSLTDVAKFGDGDGAAELGASIECACAGIMACSTCHVVVDPEWYDLVGPPSQAEQDMLDLAYAPRQTSRLGCQIQLEESMDGMVIRLPRGANNIMDDIPFDD